MGCGIYSLVRSWRKTITAFKTATHSTPSIEPPISLSSDMSNVWQTKPVLLPRTLIWRIGRRKAVPRNLPLSVPLLHHEKLVIGFVAFPARGDCRSDSSRRGPSKRPIGGDRYYFDNIKFDVKGDGIEDPLVSFLDAIRAVAISEMLWHRDTVRGV